VTHGLCRDRLSDRQDLVSWCMLHSQQPSTRLCNRSDRCPYLVAWVSRVMLVSVRVRDPSRSLHRRGRSPHRYSTSGLPGNDRQEVTTALAKVVPFGLVALARMSGQQRMVYPKRCTWPPWLVWERIGRQKKWAPQAKWSVHVLEVWRPWVSQAVQVSKALLSMILCFPRAGGGALR
jgi:hypothetical protein